MRQHQAPPPVILVSGSDPPWELQEQVEAFVDKPMRGSQLLERVGKVIACEERELGMEANVGPSYPKY